ncbi:MAG TPA: prepilin-type N-terminal cleavage/methylation domain-containing protein [Xanthobacteraceae bacterium]|nr:prepilin-type N-terminal cleavage/methylation domain-containing protein [Xanthobacteraceae bacterium]
MSSAERREPTRAAEGAARAAERWPRVRTAQCFAHDAQGFRSAQDRTRAGGFTLLETLTALAIAAVIIVATTGLLHEVLLHFDRGTRRVAEAEHLLQAVHRLAGDFASARFILRPNPPGASAPQGAGVLFIGDPSTVTFVAAGGVMVGPQGEEMVKLSVEVDGEVSRLVRRRAAWREPHARFEDMPPQDPVVMLEGRVDISFTYGRLSPEGALTWSDNWTGEFGLPRLVRVIVREPNSGEDLLAEAPFLVRADAPAACARSAQPPANNGQTALSAGAAASANVARRSAQAAPAAQASGVACLTNGPSGRQRPPDQGRTG